MSTRLPMFPLGTVLPPFAVLPLHIFEPRYRVLMYDCLLGDREFGVVLIERGSEVGGDDQRFRVATVACIHQASELPDGRWVAIVVGTRRVDVVEWLDDDPYPVAMVEPRSEQPWPELRGPTGTGPTDTGPPGTDKNRADKARADKARADAAFAEADRAVRRSLALAVQLGETDKDLAEVLLDLARDRAKASWQLLMAAPIGSFDKQTLLAVDDHVERLQMLTVLADDQALLLGYRLTRE